MTTSPASEGRARYGAIELKDSLQLYWMMGLGLAIAIHLAVVFSYTLAEQPGTGATPGPVPRPGPIFWFPPPMNPAAPAPISIAEPGIKNAVGTPVPVPEAFADPEQTLAPQNLLNPQAGESPEGVQRGGGDGTPLVIPEAAPPPFVSVEEMPKIIRKVAPVYPELAIRANPEGTVLVKIWVDREGKPREALVVKSDADIFNDAATAAAMQFLFTPAYMNSGPVSVWVTIPFRFKLADRK